MGILDDLKAVTNLGSSATGEQHANTLSAIMEYINSPQVGGISGLQQKFQEKGLGGLVSSWIGSGQNLPISADQLQSVLHSDALNQAAVNLPFAQHRVEHGADIVDRYIARKFHFARLSVDLDLSEMSSAWKGR